MAAPSASDPLTDLELLSEGPKLVQAGPTWVFRLGERSMAIEAECVGEHPPIGSRVAVLRLGPSKLLVWPFDEAFEGAEIELAAEPSAL